MQATTSVQYSVDSQGKLTLSTSEWRLECAREDRGRMADIRFHYDWSRPGGFLPGRSNKETEVAWQEGLKSAVQAGDEYRSLEFKDALMRNLFNVSYDVVGHAPADWGQEFRINDASGQEATGNACPVVFYFDGIWRYIVIDETHRQGQDYMARQVDQILAEKPANWVEPGTVFWFIPQMNRIVWESDKHFFQNL